MCKLSPSTLGIAGQTRQCHPAPIAQVEREACQAACRGRRWPAHGPLRAAFGRSRAGQEDQPRSPAPFENDTLLLAFPDRGLELVALELFLLEVVIQKDDVDRGVEVCTPECVHLVFPE